ESYDGTTLLVTILDTVTGKSATQSYTIDIKGVVGSSTAYVGFTAGTGGFTENADILNWTFSPNAVQAPAAPANLTATPVAANNGAASVTLTWNSTSGATSYNIYRSSTATGETAPALV